MALCTKLLMGVLAGKLGPSQKYLTGSDSFETIRGDFVPTHRSSNTTTRSKSKDFTCYLKAG